MKKLFIIDDDSMYRMILQRIIARITSDLIVQEFKNGQEAILELNKLITEGGLFPDIVLLDINMPVIDGWQFLQKVTDMLATVENNIAIYMVSTSLETRDKEMALGNKNVRAYLSKPVTMASLKEIIEGR